ncbi:MAG: hypothetical protein H6Q18_964, partial [Bacteroidetes bacterium]|nr:hypothetical protein [Bacteroidota bacterium]
MLWGCNVKETKENSNRDVSTQKLDSIMY